MSSIRTAPSSRGALERGQSRHRSGDDLRSDLAQGSGFDEVHGQRDLAARPQKASGDDQVGAELPSRLPGAGDAARPNLVGRGDPEGFLEPLEPRQLARQDFQEPVAEVLAGLLASDVQKRKDKKVFLGRDRPVADERREPAPQTGNGEIGADGQDHGARDGHDPLAPARRRRSQPRDPRSRPRRNPVGPPPIAPDGFEVRQKGLCRIIAILDPPLEAAPDDIRRRPGGNPAARSEAVSGARRERHGRSPRRSRP